MKFAFSNQVITAFSDIEHAIVGIPDAVGRECDAIAVRVGSAFWQEVLDAEQQLIELLAEQDFVIRRRIDKAFLVIFPDAAEIAAATKIVGQRNDLWPRKIFVKYSVASGPTPITTEEFLALRSQDLGEIIANALDRCITCSSENHHFQLPSGAHSSQFLRLAEAFGNLHAVDRVAFWIAIEMRDPSRMSLPSSRPCLLVDNPSMLILGVRVEAILGEPVNVHCMPNYPSGVETSNAVDDLLTRLAAQHDEIVLAISAASTGKLGSYIRNWAARKEYAGVRSFVLYGLQPLPTLIPMCNLNLPGYRHFLPTEECQLCKDGSEAIAVHGSTYLIGHKPAKAVPLQSTFFDKQKPFLEKYGNELGVLRAHYDDPNELTRRHHAFYIDVMSLLMIPSFVQEIEIWLQNRKDRPDLIIGPTHPAGRVIGKIASEIFKCPYFPVDVPFFDGSVEFRVALRKCKSLLIIDDLFITGARLDRFSRAIREEQELCPDISIVQFFTPIAIPASIIEYRQRLTGLTTNHGTIKRTLEHLHIVPLPHWHTQQDCPWCRELGIIERLLSAEDAFDSPLEGRLSDLRDSSIGLSLNCYSTLDVDNAVPVLGANSTILSAGSSPVQVLFACASAVQQLRKSESMPLDPTSYPVPRYLADRVFEKNYSERAVWLALLRSLKPAELEPKLKFFLYLQTNILINDPALSYAYREMALAVLNGKIVPLGTQLRQFFEMAKIRWAHVERAGFFITEQESVLGEKPTITRNRRTVLTKIRQFLVDLIE